MRKKILILILLAPILLGTLLVITGYSLIATQTGTRWLLENAAGYAPEYIKIEAVEGRLLDDFSIKKIQFTYCDTSSELHDVQIVWNIKKLFHKIVDIRHVSLGSADINLGEPCEKESETELPEVIKLPFDVLIEKIQLNSISLKNIENTQHIERIEAGIQIDVNGYSLQDLSIAAAPIQVNASLSGKLQKPFTSNGALNWELVDKNQTSWQGEVALNGDINEVHIEHSLQQPFQVSSSIGLFSPLEELSFSAKNSWVDIALPLEKKPQVIFQEGQLNIEGDMDSLSYSLNTHAKSQHIASPAAIKIDGTVDPQLINIAQMSIRSDQGSITGQGVVNLEPEIQANLSLQGEQVNPEFFIAELTGSLDFDTDLHVKRPPQGLVADVDLKNLSGSMRGYDVEGKGTLHYSVDTFQAKNFNLAVGDNILKVNGFFGEKKNNVNYEIDANDLAQLYPKLSGNLQAIGNFQGTLKNPNFRTTLTGSNIIYADQYRIEKISIDSDMYVFSDHDSNATVQASHLSIHDNLIDSITLIANGNQQQHQIDVEILSKEINADLNLTGTYTNRSWDSTLNRLQVNSQDYGNWKLAKTSEIQYGTKGFLLSYSCLTAEDASLCFEIETDVNRSWRSQGRITDLPLMLLSNKTQDQFKIDGEANLEFELQGNQAGIEGNLKVGSENINLYSPLLEGYDEKLMIQQFELLGAISSANSKFDLNIKMDKGQVIGSAHIENIQNREKAFIRQASFSAEIPSITFMNVFIPRVVINQGLFNAQVELDGYLKQPRIISTLKLSEFAFYVPDLGTEYTHGNFTSSSTEWNNFDVKGDLQSRNGKLELSGKLSIHDKISYAIDISGEDFQAVYLPDKSLVLSPKLAISGDSSSVDLQGEITIPSANLVLKELPKGTVTKTRDEVIVSELGEEEALPNKNKFDVTGEILLKFGDDVHFAGKGIKTDLTGDLAVRLSSKKIPTGQGVLKFNNASYQVLGQTLNISTGKMLFAGPLNNPELDVKVTRAVKDITAGMIIEGTVKKPQTRVFSNPAMSDANALSYLISGRALNEASGSQNALLAKAALSLGVDNSASLNQQIASTIGLDELTVGGGDEGLESTSLILGKYLSPKLYISYAYGLFSSAGTVGLDYQLTKKISLEAESGEAQAVDLIYTIERD